MSFEYLIPSFVHSDDKNSKMTIILDVSFENNQQNDGNGQSEINRKKAKHSACSSKLNIMAKVKHKVSKSFFFLLNFH